MRPAIRRTIAAGGAVAALLAVSGCTTSPTELRNQASDSETPRSEPGEAEEAFPDQDGESFGRLDLNQGGFDWSEDLDGKAGGVDGGRGGADDASGILTAELTSKRLPRIGNVVVDEEGWVLYRFEKDRPNSDTSRCEGDCAAVWPPLLTEDEDELDLTGVKAGAVSSFRRRDGTRQLALDGWPLYRYLGDKKADQRRGHGVGEVWFVVDRTGKKNLRDLPDTPPEPVQPPDDAGTRSGGLNDELDQDAGDYGSGGGDY